MTQNFLGIVDEDEPHLLAQLFRHVLDVPLVQTRQDHGTDPSPVRRQNLLLDSSDGEHLAAKRHYYPSQQGQAPQRGEATWHATQRAVWEALTKGSGDERATRLHRDS